MTESLLAFAAFFALAWLMTMRPVPPARTTATAIQTIGRRRKAIMI